jgi:hypothetical protein
MLSKMPNAVDGLRVRRCVPEHFQCCCVRVKVQTNSENGLP